MTEAKSRVTYCVKLRTKWRQYLRSRFKPDIFDFKYPAARRDETAVDTYHGTPVPDPYRWLEDPDCKEVHNFVQKQSHLTAKFLHHCCEREYISSRLTELYDFPKYSCPFKRGSHYYYFYNKGREPEMSLYQQETLEGKPKTFLDLNITFQGPTSINTFSFSESGEIFCFAISAGGSDWLSVHFKNVDTLHQYPDILERVKFTNLSWTHDNRGIFYSCYPEGHVTTATHTGQGAHQKLCYHRVGTSQDEDPIIAEFPDHPTWGIKSVLSNCGKYLLVYPWKYSGYNGLYYCSLEPYVSTTGISSSTPKLRVIPLFPDVASFTFEYVTNLDTMFYFRTNRLASNYQVIGMDVKTPDISKWTVLIPEDPKDVLEWLLVVAEDILVACYSRDVRHILKLFRLPDATYIKTFDLEIGSITCRSGKRDESVFFVRLECILTPAKIFYVDLTDPNLELKLFREIKPNLFDPSGYTSKQVFYPSKDGTLIPMYISHKIGLKMNGNNFCRLYGYGGFNYNNIPIYSPQRCFIIENLEGVEVIANIRGGGEYGENWHQAGCHRNKQNCLDDFHAAAEYLIENKYTNASKLAIVGASNGGLLVGACLNQRPDLFGAVVSIVGVLDLLRFHKFTIGHVWMTEFGISDVKEDFEFIYKISPLHNVRPPQDSGQYPPVLVLTAENDNRVVPLHSLKFVAELQHTIGQLPQQKNPLMLRVDSKAGHGSGKENSAVK